MTGYSFLEEVPLEEIHYSASDRGRPPVMRHLGYILLVAGVVLFLVGIPATAKSLDVVVRVKGDIPIGAAWVKTTLFAETSVPSRYRVPLKAGRGTVRGSRSKGQAPGTSREPPRVTGAVWSRSPLRWLSRWN